jgi:ligand-binding SRPBCC domain-containing protein
MPWSRGCDRRRALGVFLAQKSNWFTPTRRPTDWSRIERSDAVVNLAGEPLMGGRWTAAGRAVLEGSRIAVTEQLVRAMAEAKSRPRVFISGSAVGYYGDRARGHCRGYRRRGSFADLQEKGPYRFWWHNHTFQADGPRTVMEDRVYYTPPLGLLGRLANRVFIRLILGKIFQYRGDVIRLRFGVS